MNDIIEKEVQEVKNLLSTKYISHPKTSSRIEIRSLLDKAKIIKTPKHLGKVLSKNKKSTQKHIKSKKKNFSIFKRKNKELLLDFERAIHEIEKCCLNQEFKLEHIKKLLSEQKLSLKDLVYYKEYSISSTQKQLRHIGQLIKDHYSESVDLKAIDLSSKKESEASSDSNWRKEDFEREYTLTRITDFNKTK